MLGTQTRGGRMEGTDESSELCRRLFGYNNSGPVLVVTRLNRQGLSAFDYHKLKVFKR